MKGAAPKNLDDVLFCTGCGTLGSWKIPPAAISCCPERRLIGFKEFCEIERRSEAMNYLAKQKLFNIASALDMAAACGLGSRATIHVTRAKQYAMEIRSFIGMPTVD